jgi:predicted O-methyltransferase YrrM
MNSLTSAPVADVLARMFHEAQATDGPLEERCAEVASDDKALAEFLALEAKDYRGIYQQLAGYYLNISPEFGQFLYGCARAQQAKRIVEFGTSFGVSTIYLAAALRDGGGGQLIGTELEPAKAERAHENLSPQGLTTSSTSDSAMPSRPCAKWATAWTWCCRKGRSRCTCRCSNCWSRG